MKRLYDWFWELMDDQDNWYGQRVVAGFFGMAVLTLGLLMIWLVSLVASCAERLPDIGNN